MNTKEPAELVLVLAPEFDKKDADAAEEQFREAAARLYAEGIPVRVSTVLAGGNGLRFKRQRPDKAGKSELFYIEGSENLGDAAGRAIEFIYDRTEGGAIFLITAAPGFCPVVQPELTETATRIQTLSATRGWLFIGIGGAFTAPFFKRLGIERAVKENAKKKAAAENLAAADFFSLLYPLLRNH